MNKSLSFNESIWCYIEQLLPDDENVRRIVLEDFMWFSKRPIKYKDDRQMIESYAHHLELKANPILKKYNGYSEVFKRIDIKKFKEHLLENGIDT